METKKTILGKRIYLRILGKNDVSDEYIAWMNDGDILQYLTGKDGGYSRTELAAYVDQMDQSENDYLFGIFLIDGDVHIGNIKVGGINRLHGFGDLGLVIGNSNETGKGYGSESIELATQYAFEQLGLNKLIAGMMSENTGSYKAFIKAGYTEAGRLSKHVLYKGRHMDTILMEKCSTLAQNGSNRQAKALIGEQ